MTRQIKEEKEINGNEYGEKNSLMKGYRGQK